MELLQVTRRKLELSKQQITAPMSDDERFVCLEAGRCCLEEMITALRYHLLRSGWNRSLANMRVAVLKRKLVELRSQANSAAA